MSAEQFANNATTTLGSSATSGTTTITVASGTGALFPSPGAGQFFSATMFSAGSTTGVPNEIVYVTARSGDTMTVLRGQEGTSAQAWNVGDTFANYPTAAFYNGAASAADLQIQAGNSADDTGTANAGVITLSPIPNAIPQLSPIRVRKMNAPNSGAYTLNVNGLGVKAVTINGLPLVAGQLPASVVFEVVYDGTSFELISTPGVIANTGLAQMLTQTIKGNLTGGSANPTDIPLASLLVALGLGTGSLGLKGYFQVPILISGSIVEVIVQWAFEPTLSNQTVNTVNFPIAFPNAALNMVGNLGTSLVLNNNLIGIGTQVASVSQGRIAIATNSPGTTGVNYITIGW